MVPHKTDLILDSDMLAVAFSGRKAPLAEKPVEAVPGASSARSQLLTAQIGNTPLIRLASLESRPGIEAGERSGELTHDKIIIDATSGNTGIAYAMIGAARGYKVTLCVPKTASVERKRILKTFGAELVLTDPAEGSDGAIREVRKRYAENPEIYFYPDQYNNPENWRAHFRTTGVEIWRQTSGRITHFVATLGTSGTFVGTTRRLKQYNPKISAISVQPDSPFHGLEGLKHMATAIVPGIYDAMLADVAAEIETEAAYAMARRMAREEGILLGISGGAALAVAERTAREVPAGRDAVIVAVLPDSGSRYLSDRFWDETD